MNATRMIIEALKQDGLALECASAELQGDRGVEFIILLHRSTPQSLPWMIDDPDSIEDLLMDDTGLFIINGGRNSYDPVEILAKKLRKLNETNILVITILESQKLS